MATWTILRLSDMGQEEKLDSDMGHWEFLKIDMATWAYLKIDMATWPFLKIDMGHGDPPIKGPRWGWRTPSWLIVLVNIV